MGRPAGTRYAILPPALALLVVCAFALSPVDYRGGATPHPPPRPHPRRGARAPRRRGPPRRPPGRRAGA